MSIHSISRYFKKISASNNMIILLSLAISLTLGLEAFPVINLKGANIKLSYLLIILITVLVFKDSFSKKMKKIFLQESKTILISIFILISSFVISQNKLYWLREVIPFILCLAIYYSLKFYLNNLDAKKRSIIIQNIYKYIVLGSLIVIIFGYFQWLGESLGLPSWLTQISDLSKEYRLGLARMHSTLLEPLFMCLYLLLPLSILLADKENKLFSFSKRLIIIFLILGAVILSLSRGGFASTGLSCLIGLIYNFNKLIQHKKYLVQIVVLIVVSILTIIGLSQSFSKKGIDPDHNYDKGFSTIVQHLKTITLKGSKQNSENKDSINSRDEARSMGWEIITKNKKNFIFGVGPGQLGLNKAELEDTYKATTNFMLLDLWLSYGLIGLLLFFTILVQSIYTSMKNKNFITFIYIPAYLLQSISFGEVGIISFWFILAILNTKNARTTDIS